MKSLFLSLGLAVLLTVGLQAQVPQIINYQGRVQSGGVNFNGTGKFKFVITSGVFTQWSNDGTSTGSGTEPTSAVSVPVTNGVYSVFLGDTALANMTQALPASVFDLFNILYLRVWFDDGVHGSQLLSPDQRISPTGWAMVASTVGGNGVTTTSITDGAVTAAKIAPVGITNPGITASQIANKTITAAQIADGTITSVKVANGAIGAAQITANSITAGQIAASTITAGQLAANTITAAQIAANTITAGQLAAKTITAAQVADNTITGSQIADRGVGEPELGVNSVTFTQLANNSVHSVTLVDGAVTGTKIAAATVTGANIATGTVTGANIAGTTITGANIAGSTITAAQLASNSVGFDELQIGSVSSLILADKAVTGAKLGVIPAGYAPNSIFSLPSNGSGFAIPFGTPSVDTAGLFGHYTDKSKIYFAAAGIYRLDYSGEINGAANNNWQLTGGVNGGSGGLFRDGGTGPAGYVPLNGSLLVNVTAGEFYVFELGCSGGGGFEFYVVATYVSAAP